MEFLIWLPAFVILGFGVMGFRDGVVKRVLEIVGLLVTLVLTARFAAAALPWMQEHTGLSEGPALLITWAVLFIAGFVLTKLLASLLSKLIRLTILGWVDRWGGALLGALIGVLFCSVVLVALNQITGDGKIQTAYEESTAGDLLFHAAPSFYRAVRGLSGGRAEEVWSRVMDRAKEEADRAADDVRKQAGEAARDEIGDRIDDARDDLNEKLDDAKDKIDR